jgi:hypothetical protein
MASKTIITIAQEDGSHEIDLRIDFDPPLDHVNKETNPLTHYLGAVALKAIKKETDS